MKKAKNFIAILLMAALMLTGCFNTQMPDDTNHNDLPEEQISQTDLNDRDIDSNEDPEEHSDSDENTQVLDEFIYGKVKSIIGNEVEIEIGLAPDWDGSSSNADKGIEPGTEPGVSMVKVEERENPPGFEDFHIPDPNNPIYGENGEINLTYTGESRTLIIPAGADIRNTLGKKATLDSIKKGSVLMITPKVIDGKDAADKLTILN